MYELTEDDVCYLAMPLFHSNALMAGWAPALAAGATAALRERFSASQFLVDVRRYGVTYFNYVGKPLSYILATPEHPDDADNTLRQCFGNEAAEADVATLRRPVRLRRPGRLRLDRGRGHRPAHSGHPAGRARAGPCPAR